MITLEDACDASETEAVAGLRIAAFDTQDVLNLVLQRSEIIRDQDNFNRYIKQWTRGDEGPLHDLIARMGHEVLIRRAAAFIMLEYRALRPQLAERSPRHLVDIGCGYAMFDLFAARDHDCRVGLIDLETNTARHFGFHDEGAAYSSLSVAARFLCDNGIGADRITTLNPERADPATLGDADLAVSFISCGYHYPWQTYEGFFRHNIRPGGRIILDLRRAAVAEARPALTGLGDVARLKVPTPKGAARLMITRPGP